MSTGQGWSVGVERFIYSGGGVLPSSPATLDLPAGAQHFWGFVKTTGYAGKCCRVQRSSDATETDIGFDGNQVVDTAAILSFVGAGTGYVSKVYDQALAGGVDMVQATQSLMPIIVQVGVLVTNASGIPAMRGATGGRYLLAAGAFTAMAGSDFSINVLAQNNVAQVTPTTNLYSNLVGISTVVGLGTQNATLRFGVRNSASARNADIELATVSSGSNEIAGEVRQIALSTTSILTANCQSAALTGGPGNGSTLYFNRGPGTTVDIAAHSAAALTSATDIRLFSGGGVWTTNSANGADCNITSAYVGLAMTNADRNSLEGQLYDKFAAILLAATAGVPKLSAASEAFDFGSYASDLVVGKKGNVNLQFVPNASGSTFALGAAGNNLPGLRETGIANLKNDYRGSNNFGYDQTTFTAFVIFTANNFLGSSLLPGIFGFGNGTLGAANTGAPSWVIGKDHSYLTCSLQDTSDFPVGNSATYSEMLLGDINCGQAAWVAFSPFGGGGFLGVNVPAHDNNSDHPQFRTARKFFDLNQTTTGVFPVANGVTVMVLLKLKPHPNYNYAEAYNSANNVLWRNKATAVVKAAVIGGLDGFDSIPGSRIAQQFASHVKTNNQATFCHFGDEGGNLGTFDGWLHSAGFFGGKYTTDAEDKALFLNGLNMANLV